MRPAPWILWMLFSPARADGPLSTTTPSATELVCTTCECGGLAWQGIQSVDSCAQTCELKSSHFQHASGTRSDGLSGDNNCACCSSASQADNSGSGINVYRRSDVVAGYWQE